MDVLAVPLLAFAPALFWLWFFLRRDIYRPEPKRTIALTFCLGMAAAVPAGILNSFFLDDDLLNGARVDVASVAIGMLIVVGPVEETCKFLAVRCYAHRTRYFDEPSDGLVYATAASLGFASVENALYIVTFGPAVMILRAPLSTAAHVIFAALWGHALGRRTQQPPPPYTALLLGLAAAALAHGGFNVAVTVFPLSAIVIVAVGIWWVLRRFRWARLVSPFRYRRNYPRTACRSCRRQISVAARYCHYCGVPSARPAGSVWCSYCGAANRPDATYCTGCGDRFESAP